MEDVKIQTEFIRLQEFLKLAGAFETGGAAKIAIQIGDVNVNGKQCLQRGKKLLPGDRATYKGREYRVVRAEPAEKPAEG